VRKLLIWAPLAVFALLFALVASGLIAPQQREIRSAMIDKPLPALALPPLLPGRPGVSNADFGKGKPRLLNVFASWCIPCIAEAPQLMKLKAAGVEIVGVAVRDTPEAMRDFLQRNGDPYTHIGDDKASKAMLALGSSGVPETFLIDARGRIVSQHVGDLRAEDVDLMLKMVKDAQ